MLNLGRNIAVLIVGRILQGISAAVVWCVGLALVADTVDVNEIGEMIGYVFVAMSVAMLAGPLLGGVVFEKGGYNAVFAMAYALIGIDIVMRLFMIEKKDAKKWEAVETGRPETEQANQSSIKDENGEADLTITPAGNSLQSEQGTENIPVNEEKTAIKEARADGAERAIPTRSKRVPALWTLVKSRRLLCACWATFVASTLMTQFDSVLPLFVKDTFGWNSTGAGLIFLPLLIPSVLSPLIGWAIDRYGPRWFGIGGFLLFAPIEVLLRLVTHNSISQKVLLCALLTLLGVALNFLLTPLMVEITYTVEQKERDNPGLFGKRGAYAQAYGLFNVAWAGGCLVGPIWAGFVTEHAGWGTMTWTMALLAFVTAIPVGIWTGGSIFDKRKRRQRNRAPEAENQSVDAV
jgi:MFS family permease